MIYYKFKSQKNLSQIIFDAPSISVFDLKREIILANKLGNGREFDLIMYEEPDDPKDVSGKPVDPVAYTDDNEMIPRATSVIVVRRPPSKPGKGTAAKYVSDLNISTQRQRLEFPKHNNRRPTKSPASTSGSNSVPGLSTLQHPIDDDSAAIAKLMSDQSVNWDSTQMKMALVTPVYNGRRNKAPAPAPVKPVPSSYVCYRCGVSGHWIQSCPTLSNPEFENKPRLKRTTGIPKTFLKKPEKSTFEGDEDGKPNGVMLNADGEYVVAQPDSKSWDAYQAKKAPSSPQGDGSSASRRHQDWSCRICGNWSKEATRTPCCKKVYCSWCIENALLESDFVCPGCGVDEILLDSLLADEEVRRQLMGHWERKDAKRKRSDESSHIAPSRKRCGSNNLVDGTNKPPKSSNGSTFSRLKPTCSPLGQPHQMPLPPFNIMPPLVPGVPSMPFLPFINPFMRGIPA